MASLGAAPRLFSRSCSSCRVPPRRPTCPVSQSRPWVACSRPKTGRNMTMRSSSSSVVPPDMSTSGKASSNEGQLQQQQQDMADLGEARPGAVPKPGAAATAGSNVGQGSAGSSSARDTGDANPGVTPNPDAAALADRNVGPSSGSKPPSGSMGVQDRAPATVLPSSGSMADRVAQGMDEANSSSDTAEKGTPGKGGSEPGIAGGL